MEFDIFTEMSRICGNYHMHCYLCDGEGEPVEYVHMANARGFAALGFTSHAPLPFPVDWVMRREDLGTYGRLLDAAIEAGKPDLPVFKGLEIDYVKGKNGPDPALYPEINLDFTIGSVHFVEDRSGGLRGIDGPIELFEDGLEDGFDGDIEELVTTYYRSVTAMLDEYRFDILGHIDVIRKNNENNRFFDSSEAWYRRVVLESIEAAQRNGCIVEVNTGGLARGRSALYPEPWIVNELKERNVRMMVNTDAHAPGHLGVGYDDAFTLLLEAGYREHWLLLEDGWKAVPID